MHHDGPSITEQKDVRTGEPVWKTLGPHDLSVAPLLKSAKTDVVVVGAGITGALTAEALTARGLSVIVLDRRPPFHGSTAASTALLQFEIDTPLIHLAEMVGFERARRAWLRSFRAVSDLAALVQSLDLGCDFRARRALYLAGNTLDAEGLAREAMRRSAIGLPSAFLDRRNLRNLAGIDREAAVLSQGAADVNPVALTRGLLMRAAARGAALHSPAQLAEVVPLRDRVAMVTADGCELEARALVFATGYELADGVPASGHKRTSTWVFSTKPQPQALWGNGELIWEAAEPYLYIRSTVDGRVMVGGEDEDFDDPVRRDALLPGKVRALQQRTRQLFPWLDVSADRTWAGTFGESETGLPTIGAVPGMPNCHAVLGYGGNGITFGMIAAQIVAEAICGGRDQDADLFAFKG